MARSWHAGCCSTLIMTHRRQIKLAATRRGRIALHLYALKRDRHLRWHILCILHEFVPG